MQETIEKTNRTREEEISDNMGLVHACAHRFKGRGIEYDDLFSAGCMGLVKAVDAFDKTRGIRFSTYAVPVILGEMRRLFRDGGTVKVSRTLKELSLKAGREREQFVKRHGREPKISEIAQILGVELEQAAQALSALQPTISLTANEDDGGGQLDIPFAFPEEEITESISLKDAVVTLEPKDRKLIALRYFQNKTQTQTAEILNMTQVQVSRREKKILLYLRQTLTG